MLSLFDFADLEMESFDISVLFWLVCFMFAETAGIKVAVRSRVARSHSSLHRSTRWNTERPAVTAGQRGNKPLRGWSRLVGEVKGEGWYLS